jgi:hypothetical protein
MYILDMKKQIYLTIIGIGALLAIIGFASPGFRAIWGILIAGITGAIYYFNTKNEQKVEERLEGEQETFGTDAPVEAEVPVETPEENSDGGADQDPAEDSEE